MKTERCLPHSIPMSIQWHDGMPLSPQHFQELARRGERLLDYHCDLLTPYHHGVNRVELDEARLPGGSFVVRKLEAVMPDNTIVYYGYGLDSPKTNLELDLRPFADSMRASPAMISLVVPRVFDGPAAGPLGRFDSVNGPEVADENTGGDKLVIPRLVPKAHLIVGDVPPKYIGMPLARVKCEGETFSLDRSYIPPLLMVTGGSPLYKLCEELAARLRNKASRVADRMGQLSLSTDTDLVYAMRSQIMALMAALPPFEVILRTQSAHPFHLYLALSSITASVSALSKNLIPPDLQAYDHDEIGAVFRKAIGDIDAIIKAGIIENFRPYPFRFSEERFQLTFLREWIGKTLVLGVKCQRGKDKEVWSWIDDALIGSATRMDAMQASRVIGVDRIRVDKSGELVSTADTFLFEIPLNDKVQRYIEPDVLLQAFNTKDHPGKLRPHELVLYVKMAAE